MRTRLVTIALAMAGCAAPPAPLSEYTADNHGPRQNTPDSYIAYLRACRFTHGELDGLPTDAILLHGDPDALLPAAGFARDRWTTLELGTTDPSRLYIVRPTGGHDPFLVCRASPGGGGASTQVAELAALGVRRLVHVGTSGLLGPAGDDAHVLVSRAAYRDGAAVLLGEPIDDRFARPDLSLTESLGRRLGPLARPAVGYTIPIYYFQPEALIRDLLDGDGFSKNRPTYLEMEEAAVFATAARTGVAAASLTVAADRYAVIDGRLAHTFLDDARVTASLAAAVRACADAFDAGGR